MISEKIKTSEQTENPFSKMADEAQPFNQEVQFMNSLSRQIENGIKTNVEVPVNLTELTKVQTNEEISSEWEKNFVEPYYYGIMASTAKIGELSEQFIEDKDGIGIDKSIRGAVTLFSDIFGLKNSPEIEPLTDKNSPLNTSFGAYSPKSKKIYINFDRLGEGRSEIAAK